MIDERLDELRNNGIIKIHKFLNSAELNKSLSIIKSYAAPKGHKDSYFSTSRKHLLYKLVKFNFKKFAEDSFILKLAKEKRLNKLSNKIYGRKSNLKFIDGYYSKISNKEVLPWHTDQAYHGDEKKEDGYVNPDHYFLKIFIFLTDVGPDNGCMSYIPTSQKIGYAIRKGIFEKKIKYEPYWSLKDFRKIIKNKNNDNYFNEYFKEKKIIENFLIKTDFIEKEEENHDFDYNLNAGDAIIFDEGGVHKGSKTLYNDRMVLRYIYSVSN